VKLKILTPMLIEIQILSDMTPYVLVKSTLPHFPEDLTLYRLCNAISSEQKPHVSRGISVSIIREIHIIYTCFGVTNSSS